MVKIYDYFVFGYTINKHSFIRSFIHSFSHSLIHSFLYNKAVLFFTTFCWPVEQSLSPKYNLSSAQYSNMVQGQVGRMCVSVLGRGGGVGHSTDRASNSVRTL